MGKELEFTGIRDYFGDMSVCLMKWLEWGFGSLPLAKLVINIEQEGRGRLVV
jgi:tRNA threonylcarbamoyladenosine biosynthesis protein TsaE